MVVDTKTRYTQCLSRVRYTALRDASTQRPKNKHFHPLRRLGLVGERLIK